MYAQSQMGNLHNRLLTEANSQVFFKFHKKAFSAFFLFHLSTVHQSFFHWNVGSPNDDSSAGFYGYEIVTGPREVGRLKVIEISIDLTPDPIHGTNIDPNCCQSKYSAKRQNMNL
jgi:hypothetical protein